MTTKKKINSLSISGFQSIKSLDNLKLNNLNILIGANGAGKSNFIAYFRMLSELVEQHLQSWVAKRGGADRILSFGVKESSEFSSFIKFGSNGYKFTLEASDDGRFIFTEEQLFHYFHRENWTSLGSGHTESRLKETYQEAKPETVADYIYSSISGWKVFHFHDTSETAGLKRLGAVHDNEYLRSDASNLAAFLYRLRENHLPFYQRITQIVRLAIPFFDDFVLNPQELPSGESQIRLLWKQRDSDYPFWPGQLSDGSIRFICLCAALLQPEPPSTIIIDEPELGLHPYAINLLASLLSSASTRMQIIVSTQSVALIDEFSVEDLIVVERKAGISEFKHLDEKALEAWLEEYSLGELWEKNILGGRPSR